MRPPPKRRGLATGNSSSPQSSSPCSPRLGLGREADREVDVLALEVRERAARAQHDVDARRALVEAVQARQQPAVRERGERRQRQHAAGALRAEPRRRFAEQIEARRQLGQIVAAFLRQHEPAREALEQRRVEVALEPAHLLAHGRGADVQLGRRRYEAAEPRRGFERAQGVQRRQTSGHG